MIISRIMIHINYCNDIITDIDDAITMIHCTQNCIYKQNPLFPTDAPGILNFGSTQYFLSQYFQPIELLNYFPLKFCQ